MTTSFELPTKEIAALAKALGYRKRKVFVRAVTSVRLTDLNWSGGSRSEYAAVRLADMATVRQGKMSRPAPWANPYEGQEVPLVPGLAIAETGYFCGKPSTMRLYVHPEDMPKLLAAPGSGE